MGYSPGLFRPPPRGKTGGLFRIPGSLHPDGPETLGICLWDALPRVRHCTFGNGRSRRILKSRFARDLDPALRALAQREGKVRKGMARFPD
jgi:hypothetical protein